LAALDVFVCYIYIYIFFVRDEEYVFVTWLTEVDPGEPHLLIFLVVGKYNQRYHPLHVKDCFKQFILNLKLALSNSLQLLKRVHFSVDIYWYLLHCRSVLIWISNCQHIMFNFLNSLIKYRNENNVIFNSFYFMRNQ
jgi:hypothetical protein